MFVADYAWIQLGYWEKGGHFVACKIYDYGDLKIYYIDD